MGTKPLETHIISKLTVAAPQRKRKEDELKVIMCHNNIFQLVYWLDGNAAHKSQGWGVGGSTAENLIKHPTETYCIYYLLDSELK